MYLWFSQFVIFQILRSEDIEFVVAPYEADAQLAYLSTLEAENGGIIAVISEDSDLLAYGCPAVRIFYQNLTQSHKYMEVSCSPNDSDFPFIYVLCLKIGCKQIVFKMDRYGNGEEVVLHKVFKSATCVPSFRHFDKELFIGDLSQFITTPWGEENLFTIALYETKGVGSCF